MTNNKKRHLRKLVVFCVVLLIGFLIRVYFADKFIKESGDLRLYADWGEKYWQYGSKQFYFVRDWYYAPPNYPPIMSLIYALSFWLYDHKYILPQIHNATRLIPSLFIVYFYDWGYYLLLKIPAILADLGLTVLIYKLVLKITKKVKLSVAAAIFYLFNPVSIFLSGVWGQTDSLVSLFGLLSFIALISGKVWFSLPLIFVSFYIKPNWGLFIPLYLYLIFILKPKINKIVLGLIISFVIFILTTLPFSKDSILSFSKFLVDTRILPTATVTHKASVSAFNFHTIFFEIDKSSDRSLLFGIPANIFGFLAFLLTNYLTFRYISYKKVNLEVLMVSLFTIGFSGYLFLTNMLERYFFASLVPLIVIAFSKTRFLIYLVVLNTVVFLNLVYAFFRRTVGEVADLFSVNGFLTIRFLSMLNLLTYLLIIMTYFSKKRRSVLRFSQKIIR